MTLRFDIFFRDLYLLYLNQNPNLSIFVTNLDRLYEKGLKKIRCDRQTGGHQSVVIIFPFFNFEMKH